MSPSSVIRCVVIKHKGNQLVKASLLSFSLMFLRIRGQQSHSGCRSSVNRAIVIMKDSCPGQGGLGDLFLAPVPPLHTVWP